MGALTNTSIISQGMALAARDDLATSALTWLNAWLRSQYAAWPWPFLMKRARNQTLSAGTTSYAFGAGSGGATDWVHQVRDPVLVRSADYGTRNVIRIRQLVGGQPNIDPEWDEDMINSSTSRALPSYFKVRASTVGGQWILWPQRVPDRDYTISIDYQFLPADMVAGATPIYPGDETMVQLIKAKSYEYSQRLKEAAAAMEEVRQMAVNDRLRWGTVDGTNDQMQLDSKVFR